MGHLRLVNEAVPATPAASSAILFFDSTSVEATSKDASGNVKTLRPLTNAGSTTTNGIDIYIVGSNILVPPQLVRVGSMFEWYLNISKTAACTGTPAFNIRIGTTATAASDPVALTFTGVAQTAATDNGVAILTAVVTTAGASGVINGGWSFIHAGNPVGTYNAGLANVAQQVQGPTASGAVNLATASLYFGLSINPTSTGAAGVWTITCLARAFNL